MLVLHQLLYILFTLRGIFMHFLELTYWQDAIVLVPVFCCFCILEKIYRKYSQNWTKRSPKSLFCCHVHGVQRGDGEEPGGSHTRWWRWWPPGRATVWCGAPGCPLASPFRLYNAFDTKNLKESVSIHEKFCSATAIEDQLRGTEVSVPAPCWDGQLPSEPSPLTPSTPPPSPSMLLAPMMRRE
jgi:hypothetical protein